MEITNEQLKRIIKEELEAVLNEKEGKKDACYHKVKSRYKVWPSAYASGALVKCRKVGAKNWGTKTNEDKVPGGLGDKLKGSMEDQHKQLAKMHKVTVDEINAQVQKGVKVEMEHTNDEDIAHEIAMEHVYEDPKYYDKLSKIEEAKKAGSESSKENNLRDWFGRKGAKGSKGGWVDCNAPDGKGGYKECAQGKRKKYPACRPTPSACKERGKGKSWGKKAAKGKKK